MLRIVWIVALVSVVASPLAFASDDVPSSYESWVDDLWALEQVYWNNRSWPSSNPGPKPALSQVMDRAVIEARAQRTLRILQELDGRWNLAVDAHRLQIELDRLAGSTRAPETLRQLFAALDHDEVRLARALALPTYASRLAGQLELELDTQSSRTQRSPIGGHPLLEDWISIQLPTIDGESGDPYGRSPDGGGCIDDTWDTLVTEPSARSLHTAVWTGSEMIVWGGSNSNELYNSGGLYNPATDSWTEMSTVGAPAGRENHTAVWTGTEMIVWGGGVFNGIDTGGRYDPVADSWTPTTTTGAPVGRYTHVAVWSGTEMIVWGGEEYGGGRYNPSTDSWILMPMFAGPDPRPHAVAVWTGTEMLIVAGGYEEAFDLGEIYKDLWRYSPTSNSWTSAPSMPGDRRTGHAGVWTGTELFVWGGYGLEYDPEEEEYLPVELDDGWRFNPSTVSWTAMGTNGSVPSGRWGSTAVWTGTEMIVYGGADDFGGAFGGGSYHAAGNFWNFVNTSGQSNELSDHTAVWTGSEMIVWGGHATTGQTSKGARFDPGPDSWTPVYSSNAPPGREEHTSVWTGAEMIVHGGRGNSELLTYLYDPALNTWAEAAPSGITQRLRYHTAVWSGTEMIVWGGISTGSMDDGGRYNPTTDIWTPADQTNAPSPRYRQLAGWTGTEMIVVGGVPADSIGGLYDPVADSWRPMTTVDAPSAGQTTSGVVADGEFIIWGGSPQNDGYRYDWSADTWTPTSTVGAPPARGSQTAVWTGTEMIIWGGSSASSPNGLDDGGRYDPATDSWAPMTSLDAPDPRYRHVAVWTGDEMLVWGGTTGSTYPNIGGRYDLATDSWTSMTLEQSPSPRHQHTGVWSGSEMLIFGGTMLNRSPLGGRYCAAASCTATDWYRDIDGDGFGDANDVVSACAAPGGYVGTGGDCDDGNLDAWATPSETSTLVLSHDQISAVTTLGWAAPATTGATTVTYDLLRSAGADDFTGAGVCFETDDVDLAATDTTTPSSGTVFFYLSRATNACPQADGSLGSDSQSTPRNGAACP